MQLAVNIINNILDCFRIHSVRKISPYRELHWVTTLDFASRGGKAMQRNPYPPVFCLSGKDGGRGEIRTLEGENPLPVFETGAFNHSATLPNSLCRFSPPQLPSFIRVTAGLRSLSFASRDRPVQPLRQLSKIDSLSTDPSTRLLSLQELHRSGPPNLAIF